MGFSDSPKKAFLPSSAGVDKDSSPSSSNVANHIIGCNIFLSSTEKMGACRFDDRRKKDEEDMEFFASLKVKLPAVTEEEDMEEEVVDGLSTPTSSDHKIPALVCPPAPRKPKTIPSAAAAAAIKRNRCRKRVFLDLTNEVESMFPESVRADFGNKIKKVRKES
ncbi:OLC1v1007617C1 [Oldenlandia corymbosa var. corymbosa]|uniref:OLC1v1007617C1 n=1 Tax=Oldenlandia corymbosa var. corymbosa TaxID=529605 RepID=A0AAV1DM22_OLDCO|nr:OLC1v1007617C1 [Oldenlandia corymbosa var. corymbosa]